MDENFIEYIACYLLFCSYSVWKHHVISLLYQLQIYRKELCYIKCKPIFYLYYIALEIFILFIFIIENAVHNTSINENLCSI